MKFRFSNLQLASVALAMGCTPWLLPSQPLLAQDSTTPPAPALQAPAVPTPAVQTPTVQAPTAAATTSATAVGVPAVDLGTNDPTLTVRNQAALETFEPGVNDEYTLGAGDEITLEFPGRPELAGKKTIGPDGRITIPLAGPIHIADMTRDDAGKAIATALATYYNNLSVTVSVDKYSSNSVRVLGYVLHPGEQLFEGTPTLLNAISKAGLISASTVSKEGMASNTGNSIPELCTIYRNTGEKHDVVTVQLRTMLTTGNSLADMRLRRNDIIYVPEPKELFVSVLGQVGKPGTIPLTPGSTLTSVLAMAGCCGNDGGFNPKIHIIQPSTQRQIVVQYKELLTLAGQREYTIHPGDVIYVNMSVFNKAATVVQKLSPVATMVSLAAIAGVG